jgi:hypothetical protein
MSDRSRFVFSSVLKPAEYGYMFDVERWEWRNRGIHDPCACFLTYGDGMVQHSQETGVGVDGELDYLLSLAVHLKANQADWAIVARRWPSYPSADLIEFCKGLRYDENKRRWFNRADRKVSTAVSKQHDKRWEEVPTSADGSFDGVMRLVVGENRLTSLELLAHAIGVSRSLYGYVASDRILKWLLIELDEERGSLLISAFESVAYCVAAVQAGLDASRALESVGWNLQRFSDKSAGAVA